MKAFVIGVALLGGGLLACTDKPPVCSPDCTDDVCVRGTCETFDRNWTFTAKNIEVAPTEPDGTMWDSSDDSPPDPYATIAVDDLVILTTKVASDTYDADWNETSPAVNLPEANTFQVTATDSDTFGAGDLIVQCPDVPAPLTADMLREGEYVCSGAGGTMTIELNVE